MESNFQEPQEIYLDRDTFIELDKILMQAKNKKGQYVRINDVRGQFQYLPPYPQRTMIVMPLKIYEIT